MLGPLSIDTLPKVELHQHLDCSLSYDFALSCEPDLSEERYRSEFMNATGVATLPNYIACADRALLLLQTTDGLTRCVDDLFDQLAADNVIYVEIRYAPYLHVRLGLTPAQVVATVDTAVRRASAASGIAAGILLCTLRHYDEGQGLMTARLAKEFSGSAVVGLDLAGDEANFPITAHVAAYDFARREGVARTAHAGETGGPASVWETLRLLDPQRLGHGVRSIEDPALVRAIKARGIHLEVCPTSNLHTGVYATYADHSVDKLRRAGVSLGINTDGRTISQVTLADEYERLTRTFGWSLRDLHACNVAAAEASFAPPAVKAAIREKLADAMRPHEYV